MHRELLMPKLGLTMTEGVIVEWMVTPGQAFRQGQSLFVIESEKAAIEVPAEEDGVLIHTTVPVGDTVPVGAVIGSWADTQPNGATPVDEGKTTQAPTVAAEIAANLVAMAAPSKPYLSPLQRVPVTPLARRLAKRRGIDLSTVRGSGPRGRIRAADLPAGLAAAAVTQQVVPAKAGNAPGSVLQKPSSVEQTIAQRLVAAKQQIPHFYVSAEVEVSALQALRAELNAVQGGVRFTLNDFLLAAAGRALADQPKANRVWTDDGILRLTATDVGMAVNTERGLMVAVLRDVGHQTLIDTSRAARSAIERAKSARLNPAEMAGGAITVSNAGMHDVSTMTSIINPGQAMILGVGSVRELFRPDDAGQPVLRREIGLVLSADHRVLDGVAASSFLNCIRHHLSRPLGLLVV
ncbi:MAG: dihydrolipoamide acetyltransferase family protein [Burkholderiaceae bacterium]|nr:dihydrolipoamide acetyltransferase family protein [Burkholderiaceae bacterium]